MPYGLFIGTKLIPDLLNPQPDQIDLEAIEERLSRTFRFSNNKDALTVNQHRHLVCYLAREAGEPEEVLRWCLYHDHHEGIIGDIPGPLKHLIREWTGILEAVEFALDVAICRAAGFDYPGVDVRATVHHYDKLAETVEWVGALGQPLQPWCKPVTEEELARWLPLIPVFRHGH